MPAIYCWICWGGGGCRQTRTADIIIDYALSCMAVGHNSPSVPILFDGRLASTAGAALAGGMMIDAIDAHDGYKPTKGHVGCALLPSILAALAKTGQLEDMDGLLTALVAGYEVGSRCGVALPASCRLSHLRGMDGGGGGRGGIAHLWAGCGAVLARNGDCRISRATQPDDAGY